MMCLKVVASLFSLILFNICGSAAAKPTAVAGGGMQITKLAPAYFVKKDYGAFKLQLSTNIDMQTCHAMLNKTFIVGEISPRKRTNCFLVMDPKDPGTYEVTIDQGLTTEIKNKTSLSSYAENAKMNILGVDCVDGVVKCKLDGFQGSTRVVLKNGRGEDMGSTLVTSSTNDSSSIALFKLESSESHDLYCTIDGEAIDRYSKTTPRSESLEVKCLVTPILSGSAIALIVLGIIIFIIAIIYTAFIVKKRCAKESPSRPIELVDNGCPEVPNKPLPNATTTNGVQHSSQTNSNIEILSGSIVNSTIIPNKPSPFTNGTSTNGNGAHHTG